MITAWLSPAGRLHLRRRCSGNGQPMRTKRVSLTPEQYYEAWASQRVCRCLSMSRLEHS